MCDSDWSSDVCSSDLHDPNLFAQALMKLQSDPALLTRMSAAAREKVEASFSVQHMTQEYHRLYQKLASEQ